MSSQQSLIVPLAVEFFCLAACRAFYTFACTAQLELRQWTPTVCGLVFGINELGLVAVLPLSVFTVQKFGSRLMVHYGIFVFGLTLMLLGFSDYYADDLTFLCLTFLLRLGAGVGSSLAYVASFTLILSALPRKSTYSGLLVPYGVGMIGGSLLGAVAKDTNGFELGYILLGFAMICVSYAVPCSLPLDHNIQLLISTEDILTPIFAVYRKSLKAFSVQVSSSIVLSSAMCLSFVVATLGPFLQSELKFTPLDVGLAFFLLYGSALAAALAVGLLCSKGAPPSLFTATGLLSMLAGLFFIGPADFINLPLNWPVGMMGVMAFGLGLATTLVSIYVSLMQNLQTEREQENTIFGIVICVCTISNTIGSMFGFGFSGIFVDLVGFDNSTILLMFPVLFSLSFIVFYLCCNSSQSNLINLIDGNRQVESYGSVEVSNGPFLLEKASISF
ncbi:uncharacterized protein LOC132195659 [Neocloeon triangulifer]|uniref:uncharacterized protein LOC132195659 n=1 Tax=Neocloeon triangulifer TaxID=2078957 RepID=UPI00286ED7E3|nr:uncharacterized protein LOC132195659 [Neocloeon triangulifer]